MAVPAICTGTVTGSVGAGVMVTVTLDWALAFVCGASGRGKLHRAHHELVHWRVAQDQIRAEGVRAIIGQKANPFFPARRRRPWGRS
jgi:hypothetical protein